MTDSKDLEARIAAIEVNQGIAFKAIEGLADLTFKILISQIAVSANPEHIRQTLSGRSDIDPSVADNPHYASFANHFLAKLEEHVSGKAGS